MSLLTSIVLSAFLMNPAEIQVDSLKTGFNIDKQVNRVVEEVAAIEGTTIKYRTLSNTFKAVEIKFNAGILFATEKNGLNNASQDALTQLAGILVKYPTTGIAIIGHTDIFGPLKFNQKLSENRAQAVTDYLLTKKVQAPQFIEIAGKNSTEPVADNSTSAGRFANRRVEIYIILSPSKMSSGGEPINHLKTKPIPVSLKKMVEQVVQPPVKSKDNEIEIDGLLVDDTKTKTGKDFYDLFYGGWEAPQGAKNYTITVSEKPFRLTSTQIVVSINDNIVYQGILQPRQDIIEGQTEEAIFITHDYLINYEEIMKQINGEDLTGSGIY